VASAAQDEWGRQCAAPVILLYPASTSGNYQLQDLGNNLDRQAMDRCNERHAAIAVANEGFSVLVNASHELFKLRS
jgi:hypothetical protein